jgi:hypothetical protein
MAMMRLEGLDQLKKIHLIGTRSRDHPACSIVPQPTTISRAPYLLNIHLNTGPPSLLFVPSGRFKFSRQNSVLTVILLSHFGNIPSHLGRGHTKKTGNRNFRELSD